MLKRSAFRWEHLAARYAGEMSAPPLAEKHMQTVILKGAGIAYNHHGGIATVSITEAALAIRLLPPWSIFHAPLVIPFDDITVSPAAWYAVGESYKLNFANAPEIDVIITGELLNWIHDHTPVTLRTSWSDQTAIA